MKIMRLACRRCGHEEKIPIYTREEAERQRLRLVPPRCNRCGSTEVKLYD